MPGVPLAGCVLRPGRTINCEPLRREGCGGRSGRGGERNPLLLPLYPACIFNACVPLPLFSNSVSLAPSAVSLFSGHQPAYSTIEPSALSIYRALISAPRITPVRVRSHTRWIDTRDSKEPRLDRGGAQCPQRERERERG